MVTGEIIQQVFSVRSHVGTGTGFTIQVDGKQYLVTARHVLDDDSGIPLPQHLVVEVRHADQWQPLACKLVGIGKNHFDIAVLALPQALANFGEISLGTQGLIYSQEIYFLGFPYGLQGNFGSVNNDYPLPYVKRAIVSMINGASQPLLVLDGINNVGFSGGPVVFKNQAGAWQIAAVISGFNSVREPVYVENTDERSRYTYDYNTGLIDACPLEIGVAMIRANPIGFEL